MKAINRTSSHSTCAYNEVVDGKFTLSIKIGKKAIMRKSRKWKTLSLVFSQLVALAHFHPARFTSAQKNTKTFDIIYFVLLLLLLFDEVHEMFISHGLSGRVGLSFIAIEILIWYPFQTDDTLSFCVFIIRLKVRSSNWLKVSHEKLNCPAHYGPRTLVLG